MNDNSQEFYDRLENISSGKTITDEEYERLTQIIHEAKYLKDYIKNVLTSLTESIMILGYYGEDTFIVKTANEAALEMLEYREDELIGMDLRSIVKEGIDEIDVLLQSQSKNIRGMEKTFITKYDKNIPVIYSVSKLHNTFEDITDIICVALDMTIQKEAQAKLQAMATTDALTGVLNRRSGIFILEKEIERVRRYKEAFVVCFIDINDLKKVNDTLGHNDGDKLILNVSNILTNSVRNCDSVCRLGGDEFILILPKCDIDGSKIVADRFLEKIKEFNESGKKKFNISVSYGCVEYNPDSFLNASELIREADEEMYKMKRELKRRQY